MEYLEFERILSAKRMQRYKDAANGDTRKAMLCIATTYVCRRRCLR